MQVKILHTKENVLINDTLILVADYQPQLQSTPPCVCVCVCVCVHDNPYYGLFKCKVYPMVVFVNISEEFNIGHSLIESKAMARLRKFSPLTTIQTPH